MSSNELTISDISATGLGQSSPDDDVSKHNPYVEFSIGNEEHKTKSVKKAATEVQWDKDTVSFPKSAGDVLSVAVWHKRHVLSNVAIGKGQLTKAELHKNGPVEVSLTEPKSGQPAGTLKFTISGNAETESKPTTGDATSGTAGFGGGGAMAHDESGVKTGRALKDADSKSSAPGASAGGASGQEAAAISAGAAAAAGTGAAGAAAAVGESRKTPDSTATDTTKGTNTAADSTAATDATDSKQTYYDKAASAADYATEKLQDLKVGLAGQEGAAKAEGKAPAVSSDSPTKAGWVDSGKAAAASVITKAQDALQYTKERVTGSTAEYHGAPTASSDAAPTSSDIKSTVPSTAEKAETKVSDAANKATS